MAAAAAATAKKRTKADGAAKSSTPGKATTPGPGSQSADAPGSAGERRKSTVAPRNTSPTKPRAEGAVTNGERALESTLESTSKALALYKERLTNLIQTNAELQQQCQDQEKDAIEIMGALRDQIEKKDREIISLRSSIDQSSMSVSREKQDIHHSYARKIDELNGTILDKENALRLMEQEVAAVKDFKKKRADMMKEIEGQKNQMTEMERRFKESMVRMERKFFEEKVRMQKDTNRKISELAAKAQHEAVVSLDDTTKDMFRENVRLVEALKSHMGATEELQRQNGKLSSANIALMQEKEMNDLIVRDKIIASKNQNQLIRDLEAKIVTLEQTLSHVVREFEVEREILRKKARQEMDDIKRVAAQLKLNLDRKSQEMMHIKRLAIYILDQRTEVEMFFMDALDHVRHEIARERATERHRRVDHYTRLARKAIRPHGKRASVVAKASRQQQQSLGKAEKSEQTASSVLSLLSVSGSKVGSDTAGVKSEIDEPNVLHTDESLTSSGPELRPPSRSEAINGLPEPDYEPAPTVAAAAKVELSDLAWPDKERVLRVLFARMNGLIADKNNNDPPRRTAAEAAEAARKELVAVGGNEDGMFGRRGRSCDIDGDSFMSINTRLQGMGAVAAGTGSAPSRGDTPGNDTTHRDDEDEDTFDSFPKGGLPWGLAPAPSSVSAPVSPVPPAVSIPVASASPLGQDKRSSAPILQFPDDQLSPTGARGGAEDEEDGHSSVENGDLDVGGPMLMVTGASEMNLTDLP
ncbi:hypothetical protein BC828DRAFT_373928 [Blastocladiella britannica]|nr:hypothetical protein BC828DRAFT_373928 [Blastocladiella britannica]